MNKTMNSATAKPIGEKRPDLAVALEELENSVSMLEDYTGTLVVRLSPVCSEQEHPISAGGVAPQNVCPVSDKVRSLDQRAHVLTCSLRYLLSVLEV